MNRRRNYFIKKKFQASFILKFCLLIILACVVMSSIVYFSSRRTVTTSFEGLRLVVKSTNDFILPGLLLSGLVATALVSLACIAIVLFISHRIAGPLYRFEKSLEQISGGDLTVKTHLRQNDEMKALAGSLDEFAAKLKEDISFAKKETDLNKIRQRLSKYKTE